MPSWKNGLTSVAVQYWNPSYSTRVLNRCRQNSSPTASIPLAQNRNIRRKEGNEGKEKECETEEQRINADQPPHRVRLSHHCCCGVNGCRCRRSSVLQHICRLWQSAIFPIRLVCSVCQRTAAGNIAGG